MDVQRLTGPGAGVLKYDLLTALAVAGLHGPPVWQTSMLRLIALVTARYNWQSEELVVGQRDMARMWQVNERTVKREIKRLLEAGVLVCKRRGVKGRVAAYRLDFARVARLSEPAWSAVGPDFTQRMCARFAPDQRPAREARKVVALADYAPPADPGAGGATPWTRVLHRLAATDEDLYKAWFVRLSFTGYAAGRLDLAAPSPFLARYIQTHLSDILRHAAEAEFGPVDHLVVQ